MKAPNTPEPPPKPRERPERAGPMSAQVGFGFDEGHDEERARSHEVDPTPAAVVAQGLSTFARRHLRRLAQRHSVRLLDPCAGSGVFGQQAHRVFDGAERTAVEIRPEEEPWLRRNYDKYRIGNALELVPQMGPSFDLASTNPAFTLTIELLPLLLACVRAGGHVLLFGLNELGSRGAASRALWRRYPPREQWRVFGTIKFRNGINPSTGKPWGADMRSYSWWLWESDGNGGARPYDVDDTTARRTIELPELDSALRRWSTVPGREDAEQIYRGNAC